MLNGHDNERARKALYSTPADIPRNEWVKLGMGFHAAGGLFEDFDNWSAQADSYNAQSCRAAWRSFKTQPGGVGAGTLYATARQHGWIDSKSSSAPSLTITPRRKPAQGMAAHDVWSRCKAATNEHGYIVGKRAAGVALDTLRVVPDGDPLRIAGHSMAGYLMIPAYAPDGEMQSAQFIPPPGTGKKVNLPGASMAGATFTVGPTDGPAHLCEGIGAAWAVWQASGQRAVVCFGWGNVRRIAETMRQQDPAAKLVLWPDSGKELDAKKIAADVCAAIAFMPAGEANNFDANDLGQRDGLDVVATILDGATELPTAYPLSVVFADELSDNYEPPDELVQGVLTAGDGSVLYGDSNSGKTFVVIDLACAVARGTDWMGRKTEPGLVVYLAAESPSSVRGRLQAYQKHHGVKVPNFAIVQSPIDLFAGEADTDKVIKLVQMLEAKCGQAVRLIIGDTLARLSAGANENLGADMGVVVRHIDRIRVECKAHFLLIHHRGKNTDAGARGWSGLKAAVDTEIEVTDTGDGRCLEITKQRDLPTKGERIGFRLDVVTLGQTKWGAPATSCVVNAADAPVKASKPIKLGETQQAVMALLRGAGKNMRRVDIAKQLAEQGKAKTSVYNAVDRLRDVALVEVSMGMVHLIGGKS